MSGGRGYIRTNKQWCCHVFQILPFKVSHERVAPSPQCGHRTTWKTCLILLMKTCFCVLTMCTGSGDWTDEGKFVRKCRQTYSIRRFTQTLAVTPTPSSLSLLTARKKSWNSNLISQIKVVITSTCTLFLKIKNFRMWNQQLTKKTGIQLQHYSMKAPFTVAQISSSNTTRRSRYRVGAITCTT